MSCGVQWQQHLQNSWQGRRLSFWRGGGNYIFYSAQGCGGNINALELYFMLKHWIDCSKPRRQRYFGFKWLKLLHRAASSVRRCSSCLLRWFLYDQDAPRMPSLEVFLACPTGRIPQGSPWARRSDYIVHLAWGWLRTPQEEPGRGRLLPPRLHPRHE